MVLLHLYLYVHLQHRVLRESLKTPSLLAMSKIAGLLEEMYSWHMGLPQSCSQKLTPKTHTSIFDSGLPACRLDLLENILIRENFLLHIATGPNNLQPTQTEATCLLST
jgi:hypothetical protein